MIQSWGKRGEEAAYGSTVTMLNVTNVELNFRNSWGSSVTESYTGKVFGKEGGVQTANVTFGPHGYGVDVNRQVLPGGKFGAGSDGLGEGFSLSIGILNSNYSVGVSMDGFTYGSYVTNGDRLTGHLTTFAPTPLTGLMGAVGGAAMYIRNHPVEAIERGLELSE